MSCLWIEKCRLFRYKFSQFSSKYLNITKKIPARFFYRSWQADSAVYVKVQRSKMAQTVFFRTEEQREHILSDFKCYYKGTVSQRL